MIDDLSEIWMKFRRNIKRIFQMIYTRLYYRKLISLTLIVHAKIDLDMITSRLI